MGMEAGEGEEGELDIIMATGVTRRYLFQNHALDVKLVTI